MATGKIIVGNWKMKLSALQSSELGTELATLSRKLVKTEIRVAPSFTAIAAVAKAAEGSRLKLGAQNVHWEESGAFTGEISVSMLRELGCQFAIVGHSERRHLFAETIDMVSRRAKTALSLGFGIVFCIGETLAERDNRLTSQVLKTQLSPILKGLKPEEAQHLMIAYEPVWAIGTGKVAQSHDIYKAHLFITEYWAEHFDTPCVPILYGGGVELDNFKTIINLPLVAGALVGGSSLSIKKFAPLIELAEQIPTL